MLEFLVFPPSTICYTSREITRYLDRDIRIVGSMTGAPATPAPEGLGSAGIGGDVSGIHVIRDYAQNAVQLLQMFQELAKALPSDRNDEELIDREIARLAAPEVVEMNSPDIVDGW